MPHDRWFLGGSVANPEVYFKDCGAEATSTKNKEKPNVWSHTGWEHAGNVSNEFENFTLYVVECWADGESFVKIGKTFTSVPRRFRGGIPYEWKLLRTEVGSAKYISELEHVLHKTLKPHAYTPIRPFNGCYECYNIEIKENLNDIINARTTSRC